MLLTFLFLWLARPILRSPARRRQAITLLMFALTVVTSIHPLASAAAETQVKKSGVASTPPSQFEESRGQVDAARLFDAPKLREGTLIPPTIGRVVNLGRRWAFVPSGDKSADQHLRATPFTDRESLAGEDQTFNTNRHGQPLLLCENQSLQRIVEAARANPNDDRWELSGEIFEFFDQNRLLIRTAQRANGE